MSPQPWWVNTVNHPSGGSQNHAQSSGL